jgi:muconolactone delta-isomerase
MQHFALNDSTSTDIITIIKAREMRHAEYVARMGQMKNIHRILMGIIDG